MSIFEFRFCIANSADITADDIEKIGAAIAITKVREVIVDSCNCDQSHLTIVRSNIGCTCHVDGSLPIFGLFGEYDSLDVIGVQEGVFMDYGKPKRVTCSPHLPEKYQKYLHENYNMANISYYPGIVVKPDCMIMYEVKSRSDCTHFVEHFPRDVYELELLVSTNVFNPKNKKILDKMIEHIATFPNLRLLWIQNITETAIKYNFRPIMEIECNTIKVRGINNEYVFQNPHVTKIVTDCDPCKVLKYMQKNTTLKQLKLCTEDWDRMKLPEELQYLIDRNNQENPRRGSRG